MVARPPSFFRRSLTAESSITHPLWRSVVPKSRSTCGKPRPQPTRLRAFVARSPTSHFQCGLQIRRRVLQLQDRPTIASRSLTIPRSKDTPLIGSEGTAPGALFPSHALNEDLGHGTMSTNAHSPWNFLPNSSKHALRKWVVKKGSRIRSSSPSFSPPPVKRPGSLPSTTRK